MSSTTMPRLTCASSAAAPQLSDDEDLVASVREVLPSAESHFALLAMLQTITSRSRAAGVPCWVTAGTLLGAVRHGGLGPHDDRPGPVELLESDVPRCSLPLGSTGGSLP